MKTTVLTCLLFANAAASTAFAQSTAVYDATFGSAASPWVVGTESAETLNVPGFDPSLGRLTAVEITLTATAGGSVTVINFTEKPQGFANATASMTASVTGPGATTVSASPAATDPSGVALGPKFNVSNFGTVSGTVSRSVNVSSEHFSLYEALGGGLIALAVKSSSQGTYSGTGGLGDIGFSGTADIFGDVKVAYTFTTIPEPSAFAVVLSSIVFSVALVRRRQST